jgi:hypothetical protein
MVNDGLEPKAIPTLHAPLSSCVFLIRGQTSISMIRAVKSQALCQVPRNVEHIQATWCERHPDTYARIIGETGVCGKNNIRP